MTVYSYARSTDLEDALDPRLELALESENLSIQTYCLAKGWLVSAHVNDRDCRWDVPLAEREQGAALLAALEVGDVLVCASLQRLCGSSIELLELVELLGNAGVGLHVVDLGCDLLSEDSLFSFASVARLFADIESRRAAERIRTVKLRQRAKGRYLGGSRPFGYSVHDNGKLIENPTEQRTVQKILDLRRQGKSLRAISAVVSTPLTPISFKTVQRVLQRIEP